MISNSTWPNLFIAGTPRSGTTTLHNWLNQHPDIFMSDVKEPHYFSSIEFPDLEKEILDVTQNQEEYLSLFKEGSHAFVRGESSSYYLADPESPDLIRKILPSAKIIIILRDPIQRAFSHYLLYGRRGPQSSFKETIEYCLEGTPPYDKLAYNIVELGRYYQQLQRYYRHFDPSQVHIVFFNDLYNKPQETLSGIFEFLGVSQKPSEWISANEASNPYMTPRNKVFNILLANRMLTNIGLKLLPRTLLRYVRYKFLLKKSSKPQLDPDTKYILEKEYEKEIQQLEQHLNYDLSLLRESWDREESAQQ